jgi:hypothetical protein
MKALTIILLCSYFLANQSIYCQVHKDKPIRIDDKIKNISKGKPTQNTIFRVPVTAKTIKGKTGNSINVAGLTNGYYSLNLTNNTFIQFKIENKKIASSYDAKGTKMAFLQSSGYQCQDFLCTCTSTEDCEQLISDTDCDPFISIDNVVWCVKKGLIKIETKSIVLHKTLNLVSTSTDVRAN